MYQSLEIVCLVIQLFIISKLYTFFDALLDIPI